MHHGWHCGTDSCLIDLPTLLLVSTEPVFRSRTLRTERVVAINVILVLFLIGRHARSNAGNQVDTNRVSHKNDLRRKNSSTIILLWWWKKRRRGQSPVRRFPRTRKVRITSRIPKDLVCKLRPRPQRAHAQRALHRPLRFLGQKFILGLFLPALSIPTLIHANGPGRRRATRETSVRTGKLKNHMKRSTHPNSCLHFFGAVANLVKQTWDRSREIVILFLCGQKKVM